MLKVVVFDGGWGGELVANALSEEISTIEVVRVIDWQNAPYDHLSLAELNRLAIHHLEPYIGKVDLIVLGGYAVSLTLGELERRYPRQKFVGMGINYHRILKARNFPGRIAILVDSVLLKSTVYQEIRQNLPHSTIIIPDCSGWEERIDRGEMSRTVLEYELRDYFALEAARPEPRRLTKRQSTALPLIEVIRRERTLATIHAGSGLSTTAFPDLPPGSPLAFRKKLQLDAILILNTHFWELRPDLEALFGYRVRILDFRQKLIRDVCLALGLRGVDGRRPK